MLERPALRPREDLLVHRLRELGLAENHPAPWAAQRLMGGRRHHLGMGDGGRVHPSCDESREMRHVDNEYCADFIRDRPERREIDDPRIRAATADDDPRLSLLRNVPYLVVINPSGLFTDVIGR